MLLTIFISLSIFGSILAVFNSFITQNFADAYQFMNELRAIYNRLLYYLLAYPEIQTPELISNLLNINLFNLFYTNILLINRSSLTIMFNLPPNPAILDIILGYGLIIYSTLNLIQIILNLFSKVVKPYILQIVFLLNSFSGALIILGLMFLNFFIISMGALIIIICFTFIAIKLPI